MSRPLCLAALAAVLAAAFASAEDAPKTDAPRSWEEAACDPSGRGLLVRARGDEAAGALEDAAGDGAGFEEVDPGDDEDANQDGADKDKPKPKKRHKRRARKTSTYKVEPGEGCAERLGRLRGARRGEKGSLADELEVTAAPEHLPKTEAELDKFFKGAGTLGKLSRMSFKTPADLTKLFDKQQKLGSFEGARKQAFADGGAFEAPPPAAGAVLAQTRAKPDPSGTAYEKPDQLNKLPRPQAPPTLFEPERDEAEPPRVYSRYAPVRAAQRAYDWSAQAASNIADNARFTYDKLRGNAPVQEVGPLTVVGGWAKLPSSGPGFTFVGHGQYGTPALVSGLMAAAADPIADIGGAKPMQIVAISKYGGGRFPPHITHQNGTDVDVALAGFRNGPLEAAALDRNLLFAVSVVEHMKPTYILLDQRRQFELQRRAQALMTQPGLDEGVRARIKAAYPLLFVSTPAPRGKKLFSHVENHYDHFHIREQAGEIGK